MTGSRPQYPSPVPGALTPLAESLTRTGKMRTQGEPDIMLLKLRCKISFCVFNPLFPLMPQRLLFFHGCFSVDSGGEYVNSFSDLYLVATDLKYSRGYKGFFTP